MARQIQETNPELVSELRDRMQGYIKYYTIG